MAATGKFKGDRGKVSIDIHVRASGAHTRKLTLTFTGEPCGAARACVTLVGKATGRITARSYIPDTGMRFTINASGFVQPLKHVSVAGNVRGTGYTSRGRERMKLTLTAPGGRITIHAHSGEVGGFTSP